MKKFILFAFVLIFMFGCTKKNGSMPMQYKAVSLYEDNDTTTILYTFKNDVLYIDEIGNEGFAYLYSMETRGGHSYLKFYDEVWGDWYEYEIIRQPNGDIIIKCNDGDILLQKQNKIIDLGFD